VIEDGSYERDEVFSPKRWEGRKEILGLTRGAKRKKREGTREKPSNEKRRGHRSLALRIKGEKYVSQLRLRKGGGEMFGARRFFTLGNYQT